jgi:hypothetical protein
MSIVKSKPSYNTLKVTLDNGSVVDISRAVLADMDQLLEIQERLINKYIEADGSFGSLITDEDIRSDLKTLCGLLPIVSSKNSGINGNEQKHLDFDDISDNWEQLITLFFNSSLDINTREINDVSASKVSQLHFLPYNQIAKKAIIAKKKMEKEEAEKE